MEHADWAYDIAVGLSLVVVFAGVVLSILQFIGIGTMISLVIGALRFRHERQESIRRKRMDGVQRLKPTIYGPLITWAVASKKIIEARDSDEFNFWVGPPSDDISVDPDFIAIVGNKLKSTYYETMSRYEAFSDLAGQVKNEYLDRLRKLLDQLQLGWNFDTTAVRMDDLQFNFNALVTNYLLQSIREKAKGTKSFYLVQTTAPGGSAICPREIVEAMISLHGLLLYEKLKTAKEQYTKQLTDFIEHLSLVIRKGESDWNL